MRLEEILEKAKHNIAAALKLLKKFNYVDLLPYPELPIVQRLWLYTNPEFKPYCLCNNTLKWIGYKSGWRETCGNKSCIKQKTIQTNIKKWGAENPMQNDTVKTKAKETLIENWGVSSPMHNEFIKTKMTQTLIENWGVSSPLKNKTILNKAQNNRTNNPQNNKAGQLNMSDKAKLNKKEKTKKTLLNNPDIIKNRTEKIKQTNIKKRGHSSHFKDPRVQQKRIETYSKNKFKAISDKLSNHNIEITKIDKWLVHFKCLICDNISERYKTTIRLNIAINKTPCPHCNPPLIGTSEAEQELITYINGIYNGEIKTNIKINGINVDIWIPYLKLALEYNGLYWHSEEYRPLNTHINKTDGLKEIGIQLIHIWEDEWLFKNEIVKSRINYLFNHNTVKIGARKCKIKEVSPEIARLFLINNHLQGAVNSKTKIGLFYNDELISLMTFGKSRAVTGRSKKNEIELLRFCNKIGYTITGGASRLFNYYLQKYKPNKVISFSDRSWPGKLYEQLGMFNTYKTEPNYYWIINGRREHRWNWRKDKLVSLGYDKTKTELQIMHELGYKRICNSGNDFWVWVK